LNAIVPTENFPEANGFDNCPRKSPTGYDHFDLSSLPSGMYQVKVILHSNW
jgi:hypothetical protein